MQVNGTRGREWLLRGEDYLPGERFVSALLTGRSVTVTRDGFSMHPASDCPFPAHVSPTPSLPILKTSFYHERRKSCLLNLVQRYLLWMLESVCAMFAASCSSGRM